MCQPPNQQPDKDARPYLSLLWLLLALTFVLLLAIMENLHVASNCTGSRSNQPACVASLRPAKQPADHAVENGR